MKIAQTIEKFTPHLSALQCPICGSSFSIKKPCSLLCDNSHCFDFSAKGYMNFMSARKKDDYSTDLFASRKIIYGAGYYEQVLSSVCGLVAGMFANKQHINILDAGCGEGYYSSGIAESFADKCKIFGIDVSANAIKQANTNNSVLWMAADLAQLPLADSSMDIVLNILSPANYTEFKRVLKKDGLLIKLVPGSEYLNEIRTACADKLRNTDYSNDEVVEHFKNNFLLQEQLHIYYKCDISQQKLKTFAKMTPMTREINLENHMFEGINSVTIDMFMLIGKEK